MTFGNTKKRNKSKNNEMKLDFHTGDLIGQANMTFAAGERAIKKRARGKGIGKFIDL